MIRLVKSAVASAQLCSQQGRSPAGEVGYRPRTTGRERRYPTRQRTSRRPKFKGVVHRYYDPVTGQFLSVDPLVDMTGTPYAYAGDDPVNNSDPTGLICTKPGPNHTCLASTDSAFGPGGNPSGSCPQVDSNGFCINTAWNKAHPFAGAPNSYNYLCGSFFLQVCFAVTGQGSVAVSVGAGLRGVSAGEGVVLGKQSPCGTSNVNSYLSNWSAGVFGGDIFGVGASRNIGGAGLTSAQAGFTTPGISPWISFGWVF